MKSFKTGLSSTKCTIGRFVKDLQKLSSVEISKTLLLLSRFVFNVIQILVKFVTTDAERNNNVLSCCVGNRRTRCEHGRTPSLSIVP